MNYLCTKQRINSVDIPRTHSNLSGIAVKLQMNLHILLAACQRVCRDLLEWSRVCVGPEHRPNLPLVYLVYYIRENVYKHVAIVTNLFCEIHASIIL